jgi:hypothetical protein
MTRTRSSAPWLALLLAMVGPAARADLFVSSANNDSVLEYDGTTGAFVKPFVPAGGGGLSGPRGLVFGPNGDLFVSSLGTGSVLEYNGATGAFVKAFVPAGGGGLVFPDGLVFGPNGDLFVSSLGTSSVLEYNGATGAFVKAFVPINSGGLNFPGGLAFGPNGDLFVSSTGTASVLEYNGTTGAFVKTFTSGGGLNGNEFLTFSPAVPEPSSAVLTVGGLLAALAGAAARRRADRRGHPYIPPRSGRSGAKVSRMPGAECTSEGRDGDISTWGCPRSRSVACPGRSRGRPAGC